MGNAAQRSPLEHAPSRCWAKSDASAARTKAVTDGLGGLAVAGAGALVVAGIGEAETAIAAGTAAAAVLGTVASVAFGPLAAKGDAKEEG